jgi:hypothetical protein
VLKVGAGGTASEFGMLRRANSRLPEAAPDTLSFSHKTYYKEDTHG